MWCIQSAPDSHHGAILNMECNLTLPDPYHFLVRSAKAARAYVSLLWRARTDGLPHGDNPPFNGAVSAMYCTLRKCPLWIDTLQHHTGLHVEGAKILVSSHASVPEGKLRPSTNSMYRSSLGGYLCTCLTGLVWGLLLCWLYEFELALSQ